MNTTPALHDPTLLGQTDPLDLKLRLLWLTDELEWLMSLGSSTIGGFYPPPDAQHRIDRLRASIRASRIDVRLTDDELKQAKACLAIIQP
jgi:hypothetical protein